MSSTEQMSPLTIASIATVSTFYLVLIITTTQMTWNRLSKYKSTKRFRIEHDFQSIPFTKHSKLHHCWKYLCLFFLFLELKSKDPLLYLVLITNRNISNIRKKGIKAPLPPDEESDSLSPASINLAPLFTMLQTPVMKLLKLSIFSSDDLSLLNSVLNDEITVEFNLFKKWLKDSDNCPKLDRIKLSFYCLYHQLWNNKLDIFTVTRQYAVLQFMYLCTPDNKDSLMIYLDMYPNLFPDQHNFFKVSNLEKSNLIKWNETGFLAENLFRKLFLRKKLMEKKIFRRVDACKYYNTRYRNRKRTEMEIFQHICNMLIDRTVPNDPIDTSANSTSTQNPSNLQISQNSKYFEQRKQLYESIGANVRKSVFDMSFCALCWIILLRKRTDPEAFDLYSAFSCLFHTNKKMFAMRRALLEVCNSIKISLETSFQIFGGTRQQINLKNIEEVYKVVDHKIFVLLNRQRYCYDKKSEIKFRNRMMESRYIMRHFLLQKGRKNLYEMARVWGINTNVYDELFSYQPFKHYSCDTHREKFYFELLEKFVQTTKIVRY